MNEETKDLILLNMLGIDAEANDVKELRLIDDKLVYLSSDDGYWYTKCGFNDYWLESDTNYDNQGVVLYTTIIY